MIVLNGCSFLHDNLNEVDNSYTEEDTIEDDENLEERKWFKITQTTELEI